MHVLQTAFLQQTLGRGSARALVTIPSTDLLGPGGAQVRHSVQVTTRDEANTDHVSRLKVSVANLAGKKARLTTAYQDGLAVGAE